MPYQAGKRLAGEKASKLGHLEVLKNPLVRKFAATFKDVAPSMGSNNALWATIPPATQPLPLVFGVDGSYQVIQRDTPPFNARAFVKTALLRIDRQALDRIDKESPHPLAIRDILTDSAMYHATVFPLRHVAKAGVTVYDAVREIIFESLKNDELLEAQPYETLKWIIYQKWDATEHRDFLPAFECPHCEFQKTTLPFNADTGKCANCSGPLFVTDMLGFHQEMAPDSAPDTVASSYMAIHETLLLFTGIRYFWESNRDTLRKCLFVKDGPLSIRAQYSKLVAPIRRFLAFARDRGVTVHILGQEKTGAFADHLQLIGNSAPIRSLFIPGDRYIKEEIQHRPDRGAPYGKDTNYGAKIFAKLDSYHQLVLNIPTGEYLQNPVLSDLIGAQEIFSTLPTILSNRFEGALLPIELANGVASLSTYPSARILKVFSETKSS